MKYIDIHSHLNISPLKEKIEDICVVLEKDEIATITVGVDFETSKHAIFLSEQKEYLWASVGQHPNDNPSEVFDTEKFLELAKHKKVLTIGECGLDYFRLTGTDEDQVQEKKRQHDLFIKHVELALLVSKPLMIHARPSKGTMNAYEDALEILEAYKKEHPAVSGNFHFFVGDMTIAKRALSIGFSMSFDGPITFSTDYDEVIAYIPLDMIHVETDAPFAAPVPHRGQTNYPYYVPHILQRIAAIKGLDPEIVRLQLLENFETHFLKNSE